MEDKDPRLDDERIGGRSDEYVAGRDTTESGTRPAGYASSADTARGYASSGSSEATPDQRTREIRREIERTRDDMSETVNAIQDRLSPGTIASNAAESVRQSATHTAREVADSEPVHYVRANPIPTAMVGIGLAGLAWLAFGGRDADESRRRSSRRYRRDWRVGSRYGTDDYYRGTGASYRTGYGYESANAYGVSDDAPQGVQSGSNWTGDVSARASHVAGDVSRRARATTAQTRTRMQQTWNENPLLVGAAAAAIGAIVGLAIPETEREHELMGETRDNMIEGVQQTVREKVEEVQTAATKAVDQVQNAVGLVSGEGAKPESGKRRGRKSGPDEGGADPSNLGRS
jgi:hypothetical protein